ncbi:MAG TPA: hypothetical protein VJU61_00970 [Polyangiaceae bacterium]|nr:hypothetical protein [Polyangiaceae bacterium]
MCLSNGWDPTGATAYLGLSCCLALASLGCTEFASEFDTLPAEAGEETRVVNLETPGDWSCASDARPLGSASSASVPLTYAFSPVDFVTGAAVSNVRVRACFRPDVGCDSPETPYLAPESDGKVRVPLYSGFNGYLEVTSDGMLPVLLFFASEWSVEFLAALDQAPLQLLPVPALQALGDSARVQLDPGGGVLGINTFDCVGASASGVRLEVDSRAVPYAFVNDLPVLNQDVTSEQGLAGFVNVSPGVVVLRGFSPGSSSPLTVETLLVRSAWLTSVSLLPGFVR